MGTLEFPEPFDRPKSEPAPVSSSRDKVPRQIGGRMAPLEKRLHEAISSMGLMIALVNEVDGLAICDGAERLASALDKAAKQNPRVKRALEAALTGGVWAEVTFATGAIMFPIAINHGLMPDLLGIRRGNEPEPEPDNEPPADNLSVA